MASKKLEVILTAKDDFSSRLRTMRESVVSFGDRVKSAFVGLGATLGAVSLGAFFKSSIEEANKAEVANQQLTQSISNLGGSYAGLKPLLDATIAGVRRLSTYTADDLSAALTTLITISGNVSGSMNALQLAADLAAAKHIDLGTAATAVGNVLAGNTGSLARMGIVVRDGADAIQLMRDRFSGFAAGEAATLSGRLTVLSNQWGDVQASLGRAILGADSAGGTVSALTTKLIELEQWITRNADSIGALVTVLGNLASVLGSAVLAPINVIRTAGGGLEALSDEIAVGWRQMVERARGGLGPLAQTFGDFLQQIGAGDVGVALRQVGDQMVQQAKAEHIRLAAQLDQELQNIYNRSHGRKLSVPTPTRSPQSAPPVPGKAFNVLDDAVSKEVAALVTLATARQATAEDLSRLSTLERALTLVMNDGTVSVADRAKALAEYAAIEKALAGRNEGLTTGRGNQILAAPVPGSDAAQVAATQGPQIGFTGNGEGVETQGSGVGIGQGGPDRPPNFANAFLAATGPLQEFNALLETTDQTLGRIAGETVTALTDNFIRMFEAIGQGQTVFGALSRAIKHAIAQQAAAEGKHHILSGVAQVAKGIGHFNPAMIAGGLKEIAAGGALVAFAGSLGGGGGGGARGGSGGGGSLGGGGGSLSPDRFTASQEAAKAASTLTVILPAGAMLRASDPGFQEFFADVARQAQGRHLIFETR